MPRNDVFSFSEYKEYLEKSLEIRALNEKGQKSKLAEAIGCQPAYLSQVLNGPNDLSPEQGQSANRFLGHNPAESRYFLSLILLSRAGTQDLKNYYRDELKKLRDERLILKNRVNSNRTLSEADQARYYSSWYFAAVHVVTSLGYFPNKDKIAQALGLPLITVVEVLDFLTKIGLLEQKNNEYKQGETNLYLGSDSPFITKHHTNWRVKAIQSLDQKAEGDLHYSGVITCSKDDAKRIHELLIQTVEKIRSLVRESKDETLCAYTLDFFGLLDQEHFISRENKR